MMNRVVVADRHVAAQDFTADGRLVGRVLAWFGQCYRRTRQRRELAELDERMLHDIGVTREQMMMEIGKPFWC